MTAEVRTASFGRMPDGRDVPAVTLANGRGAAVTVIAYGAAVRSLVLPDARGAPADVALGCATLAEYLARPQYFGATVGRFANRVARGRFRLDGREHRLSVNDGPNSLHGGADGFDKRVWDVAAVEEGPAPSVTFRLDSPDGDGGYPGRLAAEATYALGADDRLRIEYRATSDADTVVNLSNHTYWNLGGEGSAAGAMGHEVTIPAERYLPTDAGSIPTGERRTVAGTPFDFREARAVGDRVRDAGDAQLVQARGYDHNWIVRDAATDDPHLMARVRDPASGRAFELWSNQPGLQFYSGNFLDGTTRGKAGRLYRQGDAIVLEPQLFPDTPNRPDFPSALLRPGEAYRNVIEYRFTR